VSIRKPVVLMLLLLAAIPVIAASKGAPKQKIESGGVSVELLTARAVEGKDVLLRFAVKGSDGSRLSGIRPAAWIDARGEGAGAGTCKDKIQAFLGGTLRARPQVDLNAYYVLTLNAEPSVAVIDPLLGFGGSKLLTAVTLQSPGADWALTPDQRRLFVSMPLVNRVAVIDTDSWTVISNIEVGFRPGRLALHDVALWVLSESTASVIDVATLGVRRTIDIGKGPHQIAFAGKRAYISGPESKTVDDVTLVDADALAYSSLSNSVFALDRESGVISIVGTERRIQAKPGIDSIAFAPGGRWGFVTNRSENAVHVLDSSTAEIVTTATDVGNAPDQISFTDDFAYVRAAGSEQVKMIRLSDLGKTPEASIATFPGGQLPAQAAGGESFAAAIVPAPEPKAVLVANPGDRTVYYYMEGMAAPMGNFSAARRSPKAALVLDRSLRESEPGVFSIRAKMPPAGEYDVAFFLNTPRVVHCFDLAVKPDPASTSTASREVAIEPLLKKTPIAAGSELEVRFRVTDPKTRQPHADVRDLRALAYLTTGWQQRFTATAAGEGVYSLKFTVPEPGIYYVFFESPSLQLTLNDGSPLIFEATAP
jgi:YVTN family beta-propeller protein